jgi:hypothetical protein
LRAFRMRFELLFNLLIRGWVTFMPFMNHTRVGFLILRASLSHEVSHDEGRYWQWIKEVVKSLPRLLFQKFRFSLLNYHVNIVDSCFSSRKDPWVWLKSIAQLEGPSY